MALNLYCGSQIRLPLPVKCPVGLGLIGLQCSLETGLRKDRVIGRVSDFAAEYRYSFVDLIR